MGVFGRKKKSRLCRVKQVVRTKISSHFEGSLAPRMKGFMVLFIIYNMHVYLPSSSMDIIEPINAGLFYFLNKHDPDFRGRLNIYLSVFSVSFFAFFHEKRANY